MTFARGQQIDEGEWPTEAALDAMSDEELDRLIEADQEAKKIPCVECGRLPTRAGHDACIAALPGVRFACCGHRASDQGLDHCYVVFDDGLTLYGNAARAAMQMLGGNPPPAAAGAGTPARTAAEFRPGRVTPA